MMVKPRKLKHGDRIGIVAPSSPVDSIDPRAWKRGLDNLKALGFDTVIAPHVHDRTGHTAGTPEARADDIMEMFNSRDVDGVMSVFGGYNSNHLLDLLDYKAIKRSRKVFCGYSDVTALNMAIMTISGLVNFSGPALVTFCQPELPKYTIENFLAVVCSAEQHTVRASDLWAEDRWFHKPDLGPREWMANPGWTVLQEGTADGETIGGNLNTILALAGTDYWPEMHGRVLFIEEDDTGPAALIDRNLQQLRMMGVFDELSGLVVGRIPTRAGFNDKDRFEDAILAATLGYDMPIVTGVDLSHTDPLFTIPLGVGCRLDARRKEITFHGAVE